MERERGIDKASAYFNSEGQKPVEHQVFPSPVHITPLMERVIAAYCPDGNLGGLIQRMYAEGQSQKGIGRALSVSGKPMSGVTVSKWMEELNIETRSSVDPLYKERRKKGVKTFWENISVEGRAKIRKKTHNPTANARRGAARGRYYENNPGDLEALLATWRQKQADRLTAAFGDDVNAALDRMVNGERLTYNQMTQRTGYSANFLCQLMRRVGVKITVNRRSGHGHARNLPPAGLIQAAIKDGRFNRLPPRSQQVLQDRVGVNGQGPKTLKEIGEELGIKRERTRQIEKEALEQLKSGIQPKS